MPIVVHIGLDKVYDNPYNENISNWNMRFMKILTSRSIKYTEELAGKYKDLKEVARLMREYSEDTSNLIYYDKEAMDESIRKTDLKFAKEEGFDRLAYLFEAVGKIEKEHEERYRKLIENMDNGLVFSKDGDAIWKCRNCGHIVIGKKAPEVCPVCAHPKAYFEIKAENY